MENKNELEKLFRETMSVDELIISDPDIALVSEARKKILMRKQPLKKERTKFSFFDQLFSSKLKFYRVGFSILLTCICLVYSLEINHNSKNGGVFNDFSTTVLASNTPTISVNSSTLLTSIPTLIIRN
jgi:hypothetical protein